MPPFTHSAAVRELLHVAFSNEELTTFCFDHFHPVHADFSSDMTTSRKIQLLLEYCERRGLNDNLLAAVQRANPTRYAEYTQRVQRSSQVFDALLTAGLASGRAALTSPPPALAQAASQLAAQSADTRQARLADLLAAAAATARAEFKDEAAGRTPLNDLLADPIFLQRMAEIVLLGERPDLAQLRAEFLPRVGVERWEASQRPILRCLQELERSLLTDEVWGPTMQGFRTEATLASIDRSTLALSQTLTRMEAALKAQPDAIAEAVARRLHPLDLAALEKNYLRGVYADCNHVPLASGSAPPDAAAERRPRLQKIYVNLDTTTPPDLDRVYTRLGIAPAHRPQVESALRQALRQLPEEGLPDRRPGRAGPVTVAGLRALADARGQGDRDRMQKIEQQLNLAKGSLRPALADLSVLEAIGQRRQLVILGDPGSGKSTLTRRLAGGLAAASLDELAAAERDWATVLTAALDRWLLPVRIVLSRWAAHLPTGSPGCADDLIDACLRVLKASGSVDAARQREHFVARLAATPPTALLLLDGLDEVADAGQRQHILAAIEHFVRTYPQVRLLVTCRVRPYREGEHYRLSLPAADLASLDRPAVGDFLQRWHDELTWAGLYQPAAAASAHKRLLEAMNDAGRQDLREMAGVPLLLTMMARVNYDRGLPESRAALYEEFVRKLLWEWEHLKLDDQGQPTGLEILLRQAGVSMISLERALNKLAYTVHAEQGQRSVVDIPRHAVREALEEIHTGDDAARAAWTVNVLRLIDDRSGLINAVEQNRLYRFSHRTFQEYLAARWLATGEFVRKFKDKVDKEPWQEAVFLALGHQVAVLGRYDDALTVIDELLPAAPASEADWRRVLLLGEAYARLLGPQRAREAEQKKLRERVLADVPARLTQAMHARSLPPRQRLQAGLLLDDLGVVPPGLDDFVSGSGWEFAIGRYPVTNKQYRRFMEAGGYAAENEPKWWSEKGRDYKRGNGWTEPYYWDDARFNHDSQPVVSVSLYEANAYCAWLTGHLRSQGKLNASQTVRLPTQAEWEQAARAADGRPYPWGGRFDPANANTKESSLAQTTPVWMYPDGRTPEGVWDLAGNVWEWTSDNHRDWGKALCGGSCWDGASGVGAAARDGRRPRYWNSSWGLRVVVVPVSHAGK